MRLKILVTNDDCHTCPLLALLIEVLAGIGDVTVVVPRREQSWQAKAKTRFSGVNVEETEVGAHKAFVLDGTPADCVNIGAYHLFDQKPDLVVSGINAGVNVGLGFIMSSGTLGACFEANIANIPALAFSQALDKETRRQYLKDRTLLADTIKRLKIQTDGFLERIFTTVLSNDAFLANPLTWNFNFPFAGGKHTKVVPAPVGLSYYGSSYYREEMNFFHSVNEISFDNNPACDGQIVEAGDISVTAIDIRALGQLLSPGDLRLAALFQDA